MRNLLKVIPILLCIHMASMIPVRGEIEIHALLFEKTKNIMPPMAAMSLENKLTQIATAKSKSGYHPEPRFFMSALVTVENKEIIPGAPSNVFLKLSILWIVGDARTKTIVNSYASSHKGVGSNENKAWVDAINQVSVTNPNFSQFMSQSRQKIASIYAADCQSTILEVQALSASQQYDAALKKLFSVPEESEECYKQCMQAVPIVFVQYADMVNTKLLAELNTFNTQSASFDPNKVSSLIQKSIPLGDVFTKIENWISQAKSKSGDLPASPTPWNSTEQIMKKAQEVSSTESNIPIKINQEDFVKQ